MSLEFNSWPRSLLAAVMIGGGIFLVLLLNPFHSVCDTQEELFREELKKEFFVERKLKQKGFKSSFERAMEDCSYSNSPGGCFDFFQALRKMERELSHLSQECSQQMARIPEIRQAFQKGLLLVVNLAWGEKTPETYLEKTGWLGASDLHLFCQLKRQSQRVYGISYWKNFSEERAKEFIDKAGLTASETLSRSLLSLNCRNYY